MIAETAGLQRPKFGITAQLPAESAQTSPDFLAAKQKPHNRMGTIEHMHKCDLAPIPWVRTAAASASPE
jgi:hypothetical protein